MGPDSEPSRRILVLAPIGRDGPATVDLLGRSGIAASVCESLDALVRELTGGAAAVIVAEEALFGKNVSPLLDWIRSQPAWSDLPFIVLTGQHEAADVAGWRRSLVRALGYVALLQRPVQVITLSTTMQAALRARERQYEVRQLIEAQARAADALEVLVAERTKELEASNELLRAQMAERARVEEALRQAQKIEALGQLTGGIAHDFNNLLMVISGGLEMLERQTDPHRRKRLMEGMAQAAQRGSSLTRQLLAFSRRQELKPEAIHLGGRMAAMRDLLDRSLRGDVHVRLDFPGDLWPVEVDPGEFELAILNLAVNARDAMPGGGTIVVHGKNIPGSGSSGDLVCVSVSDSGHGMTEEVKARVFEPFFTTKDIGKGSGLGLAQVHGFIVQSGGTIEIDSVPGQGTAIRLLLPRSLAVPGPDPGHLASPHRPAQPQGSAGTVLLVEDDDEVAAMVSEMLAQLGYAVTRVASAAAALGALANGRAIDLVFSDIMMPGGMDGVDLAREIRSRRGALPVLLTSGYAEAAAQAAEAEAIPILAKPYQLNELAEALARAVANEPVAGPQAS